MSVTPWLVLEIKSACTPIYGNIDKLPLLGFTLYQNFVLTFRRIGALIPPQKATQRFFGVMFVHRVTPPPARALLCIVSCCYQTSIFRAPCCGYYSARASSPSHPEIFTGLSRFRPARKFDPLCLSFCCYGSDPLCLSSSLWLSVVFVFVFVVIRCYYRHDPLLSSWSVLVLVLVLVALWARAGIFWQADATSSDQRGRFTAKSAMPVFERWGPIFFSS